jgi:hypothetical protein
MKLFPSGKSQTFMSNGIAHGFEIPTRTLGLVLKNAIKLKTSII